MAGRIGCCRTRAGLVWLAGSVLLAGCLVPRAWFVPVGPGAYGHGRQAGAYHQLSIAGRPVGKVKVWSEGISAAEGVDQPVLHAGLRVHNDSEGTVRIDPTRTAVEIHTRDGRTLIRPAPRTVRGPVTVPPGAAGRVRLEFSLPEGAGPSDVAAFEVHWVFFSDAGRATLPTPFQRADRRLVPYPVPYLALGYPFVTFGFWYPYLDLHRWYPLSWYRPWYGRPWYGRPGSRRWAPRSHRPGHTYRPQRKPAPRPAPGLRPRRPEKKD